MNPFWSLCFCAMQKYSEPGSYGRTVRLVMIVFFPGASHHRVFPGTLCIYAGVAGQPLKLCHLLLRQEDFHGRGSLRHMGGLCHANQRNGPFAGRPCNRHLRYGCAVFSSDPAHGRNQLLKLGKHRIVCRGALTPLRQGMTGIIRQAEGVGTGRFRQRTARQRRWICGTERGRMPPAGTSQRVDRIKSAVCCRGGCYLVAGSLPGIFRSGYGKSP